MFNPFVGGNTVSSQLTTSDSEWNGMTSKDVVGYAD
jgi:hypothetical protein